MLSLLEEAETRDERFLIGGENHRAGCSDTITFDGELAKVDRFSMLSIA